MARLRFDAAALDGARRIVIVSPHLDDGVMSCGCLIARLARRRPVMVATVFAGRSRVPAPLTEWDRAAGFDPGSDVVAARQAEDRAALALLGAHHCWLPFADSQYGTSPRASAIARRFGALANARAAPAAVLFPLGLFHSDHRLAREAMLALMRREPPRQPWFAYEDALYRRLPGLVAAAVARLRRAGLALSPARFAADAAAVRRKARAVACYRSQLRALATPGRPGHADSFAEERYWRVTSARRRRSSP
jgi:LmbE family N-acetylglucosaminyl deacetylase